MKTTFLFFVMVLIGLSLNAQVTILNFSGKDVNNNYVRLDSVVIKNFTRSWQETIYYPDTILIMGGSGIDEYGTNPIVALSQNIPNPFNGVSDFSLQLTENEAVTIFVIDLNGRKITEIQQTLSSGTHSFRVFLSTPQTYLLSVKAGIDQASIKIINTGNGVKNRIDYLSSGNAMPVIYQVKSAKGETENPFDNGDSMEYVGYTTMNGFAVESEVIRQAQIGSGYIELVFPVIGDGQPCYPNPTLTDADGNVYNTVQIGTQCWMKENLRVTQYAVGTDIQLGTSTSTTTAYRYYPNNNSSNLPTYGYLYNWAAVMGGSDSTNANPSGVQGICPTGWHVPSGAEWTQMTGYVSSQSQYVCGSNSTFIAKALASQSGWNSSTTTPCAIGNIPSDNNATGFSVLPAGTCDGTYGTYGGFGNYTDFSTTTLYDENYLRIRGLNYGGYDVGGGITSKSSGISVRCVRD